MPAGFYAQADPSDPTTLTNWVQLNSSGIKIDSGLCDTSTPPPAPEPTPYTGLVRCDNNTTTWYTTQTISSGNSFYSAGLVCYISTGTIYDITGKTFIDGTEYSPGAGGPCDCDCYNINCGSDPLY
jgi:hypothetical protein